MKLPNHKTKIICTLGPACRSLPVLKELINSGMNVGRLNFSHATYPEHLENIQHIRQASKETNKMVTILIDLPGTKMRVGKLSQEIMSLKKGDDVILSTKPRDTRAGVIPIDFHTLAKSVKAGNDIYLFDGFIHLKVQRVTDGDVHCKVLVGGELRSHKGLNLPGAKIFANAVTKRDLEHVAFGLKHGVYTFGVSFVHHAKDIIKVRKFAESLGKKVYLIAKIERREAIDNFDEILKEADAIMIARGDLGVEIPTEEVPVIQKQLIHKANMASRPVIIATQMLESMTENVRPTRAEVTDVANAILDGGDAIMLSEETSLGQYPVETVAMMAKIAAITEHQRETGGLSNDKGKQIRNAIADQHNLSLPDILTINAVRAAREANAKYIITATRSGATARRISRFKPHSWTIAFGTDPKAYHFLAFSYGIYPILLSLKGDHLKAITNTLQKCGLVKRGDKLVITERRISKQSGETDSMAVVKA